ncbi:YqgQ family protein [Virgibacillus oceani]|uniref:Cytosolic protein n=1 Tax=Virgibacillus oceani TaxID=1479511 RepID=A0A917H0Y6_9BACI|nr:YqgQ family protein [Virgibacillus oceani]GGG63689.1 hypothetical protein GCM10011398_03910 [Virgibacillus oceani]
MNTVYDIQQLLKKFGTFIYIGDRMAELELMEMELKELYDSQFIRREEYTKAILILRKEAAQLRDNQ